MAGPLQTRLSFIEFSGKGLGIYYLLSAFIFGISGTLISVLIRIELYSSGNRLRVQISLLPLGLQINMHLEDKKGKGKVNRCTIHWEACYRKIKESPWKIECFLDGQWNYSLTNRWFLRSRSCKSFLHWRSLQIR